MPDGKWFFITIPDRNRRDTSPWSRGGHQSAGLKYFAVGFCIKRTFDLRRHRTL